MIDLGEAFRRLRSELSAEEQCGPISGLFELGLHKKQREELERHLTSIEREVGLLRQRVERLPALPDVGCIRWAQSVLTYPNGRILIVDTAFTAEEAEIIHVLLLSFDGTVCFERRIAPGCALSEQTVRAVGMTTRDLLEAPSLPHIWPSLLEAILGRYLLSYDLKRASRALERAAEQYGLDPLPIIGDCLLQRCQHYFQPTGFIELPSLCRLVGCPLPETPDCMVVERARGQLHLLRSMALGITGAHSEDSTPAMRDNGREDSLDHRGWGEM